MKYRKKPVVIDAMLFTAETLDECVAFCGGNYEYRNASHQPPHGEVIEIKTLEGVMLATPGDWIIKGVNGEFYPCKPDIFAATYEPASSANDQAHGQP